MEVIKETEYLLECSNEYKDIYIRAKWDGCCDIRRYYNGDTYETGNTSGVSDYIHICELREFIEFLTEVADRAEKIDGFEGY